jgi:membrane protease YdiL (CAAX protease family)
MPASVWFAAALLPMVASQIVRLQQHDTGNWLLWDYAGRLGGLAMLAIIPSARAVAFRRERLRIGLGEVALWFVCIVLVNYFAGWIQRALNAAFPATALGGYPQPSGWFYVIDIVFGLALVALSEEIFFRRCASEVFQSYFKSDYLLIAATSILFGLYHWWAGIGAIVAATIMGALWMQFLRRSGSLWPVVVAHYLVDLNVFYLS